MSIVYRGQLRQRLLTRQDLLLGFGARSGPSFVESPQGLVIVVPLPARIFLRLLLLLVEDSDEVWRFDSTGLPRAKVTSQLLSIRIVRRQSQDRALLVCSTFGVARIAFLVAKLSAEVENMQILCRAQCRQSVSNDPDRLDDGRMHFFAAFPV